MNPTYLLALGLLACGGPEFTTAPLADAPPPDAEIPAPPDAAAKALSPPWDAPVALEGFPDAGDAADAPEHPPDAAPEACAPATVSECTHHDAVNVPGEVCWYQSNNGTHGVLPAPKACACDFTCACAMNAAGCNVAGCVETEGRIEITCR